MTENNTGMTLTAIAAKIYNVLLSCIRPEVEKILRKSLHGFRRNCPTISQLMTICQFREWVRAKNIGETQLFENFSKAFDSIHRGKMEQILLTYRLPETVIAINMLYKNTNAKVRSSDKDTDFFNLAPGVLQGETLSSYLLILCLDCVLRTSINPIKENGYTLKIKKHTISRGHNNKCRLRRRPCASCCTSRFPTIKPGASSRRHVNANKREYMCFK